MNQDSELMFGFVAPIGANLSMAEKAVTDRCIEYGYTVHRIHITVDVLPKLDPDAFQLMPDEFTRFKNLMDVGTRAREQQTDDIVARGVASEINRLREKHSSAGNKNAYIIHSLKHPDEVRFLRDLYPRGFYLVALNVPGKLRKDHLVRKYKFTDDEAEELMRRDKQENDTHGQRVNDTFHLADFFIGWAGDEERVNQSIYRFIDIIFGHPNHTPAFGEYAMFLAFSASLRSADLSRQVGAVIARDGEILSMGANDCPKAGGGLYWPRYDPAKKTFSDYPDGRDYIRGIDSNKKVQLDIIKQITDYCSGKTDENKKPLFSPEAIEQIGEAVKDSTVGDLTEFGRVVHAEMEALLACARKGVSPKDATIYCTTFPCHNCAKHIIAAGVRRVVFIEPYMKSKALELHDEILDITYPIPSDERPLDPSIVRIEPFFGIGPRRFFDLFSMNFGTGTSLKRKDKISGEALKWTNKTPRISMSAKSYLDREREATEAFKAILEQPKGKRSP